MTQVRAYIDGRVVAFADEGAYDAWLQGEARRRYPERYAPNGEELRGYPGASWEERTVAWRFAQGMAEARAAEDDEPEIPASEEDMPCWNCKHAKAMHYLGPNDQGDLYNCHADVTTQEQHCPGYATDSRPSGDTHDVDQPYGRVRGEA